MKPKAAPNRWPYLDHRTMAEVNADRAALRAELVDLDQQSRNRALSLTESLRLERLLRTAA